MRRLMQHELALVSGGSPTVAEGFTTAGALGAGFGANLALATGKGLAGIAATAGPAAAITVAGAAASGVAAAGYAGWTFGTFISKNLPTKVNDAIGKGIADRIDIFNRQVSRFTDLWIADDQ